MKNAIAYRRVSTKRQGQHGIGLDAQTVAIEAYARKAGYNILSYEQDIQTGIGADGLSKRPGLRAAVRKAKAADAFIIVADVSRLARNSEVVHELLIEMQVKVRAIGAAGDPVDLEALAARSQYEGEEIARRTKAALDLLRAQGVQLGNRTNLPEATLLAAKARSRKADEFAEKMFPTIRELDAGGFLSDNAIANELNRRKVLTSRGGTWTAGAVGRIINRMGKPLPNRSRKAKSKEAAKPSFPSDNKVYGSW